jgi:hypothetical protein
MNVSYPPIRIHIWGGLGSQLSAWACLLDLQKVYPKRRFIMVFHNGGVTLRTPELIPYLKNCQTQVVNDFRPASERFFPALKVDFVYLVGGIFKLLARTFGFAAASNTDEEFARIRPWVTSLRGHYSSRQYSKASINEIFNILFADYELGFQDDFRDYLAVHFRLGDLVELNSKSPLDSQRIAAGINAAINACPNFNKVVICSDSPQLAIERLTPLIRNVSLINNSISPSETIYFLANSPVFIGTPSKISEWVSLFREYLYPNSISWLPREMSNQMSKLLHSSTTIKYY